MLDQRESIAMADVVILPGILYVSGEQKNRVTQVLNMLYSGSL